ncbi:MAG: tripartite tricarboxylate transporter substrate binding protein [Burkholderiales bacterium]
MNRRLALQWSAAMTGGAWPALRAQSFPSRPLTIVVPYAPGGATDVTARRLAELLAKTLRVTVVVDNKPGAATTLAAAYVARASKDGYTLLMAPATTTAVNPYLYRKLSYKPEDFAPISMVSKQTFTITVGPDLPARNIQEFIAWAKAKPSGISYGTTGSGSLTNIVGEWIGRRMGIKMQEIPYKGTAPSTLDIIAGRLDMQIEGISTAIPMHNAGKTRVLAVMSEQRSPLLKDVPTLVESGYPDLVANTTFGLLAPAGTPVAVIEAIHAATVQCVADAEFTSKVGAGGEIALSSASPAQYGKDLASDYAHWGKIIPALNIQID